MGEVACGSELELVAPREVTEACEGLTSQPVVGATWIVREGGRLALECVK